MKKIKYLLIVLFIFGTALLASCDQMGGGTLPAQLSTPTNVEIVPYDDVKVVFFDSVPYAEKYQIRILKANSAEVAKSFFVTTEDKLLGITIDGLDAGEYTITIKAFPADDSTILNSLESEPLNFNVTTNGSNTGEDFNVVFDTDGGSNVETVKVAKGSSVTKPNNPTKEGYTFLYWSYEGNEYDFTKPIFENTTLKAVWEKNVSPDPEPDPKPNLPTNLMAYYKEAEGLTGSALKAKLRSIISANYKSLDYSSGLGKYLPYTDADPKDSSKMILFYGHVSVKGSVDNTIANREHVWPKSLGWFEKTGAGCDIHHIRPENPSVNSSRGNLKMGEVTGGTMVKYSDGTIAGYKGNGLFEPNDVSKGDVARIYLYMMVRYSQADSSYKVTNTIESIETLLRWHKEDPVDELEIIRNNRAHEVQGNRNPFIDYPEFAEILFG